MNQHVSLTFSLKYLVNFSKSSSLSNTVQLMMSNDVPLLVSMNEQMPTEHLLTFSSSGIIQVRSRCHKILSSTKDWGGVNRLVHGRYIPSLSRYRVAIYVDSLYIIYIQSAIFCHRRGPPRMTWLFYTKL